MIREAVVLLGVEESRLGLWGIAYYSEYSAKKAPNIRLQNQVLSGSIGLEQPVGCHS